MLVEDTIYTELMKLKVQIDQYEKKKKSEVQCVIMYVLDIDTNNEEANKLCYSIEQSMSFYLSTMYNRLVIFKVSPTIDVKGNQYDFLTKKQLDKYMKTDEWKFTWHK